MDLYMDFIKEVVTMLPKIDVTNNIISAYLGGSLSRGDYIIGISDIDIYVVLNTESNEAELINSCIQDIAKNELPELLAWCHDGVTVAFTNIDNIHNGTSWLGAGADYYSFIDTGRLLYGKDIKQDLFKPSENNIFAISQQSISQLKEIVNGDLPNIICDKYFVRGLFGTVYSAMHFQLCLNKLFIRGKANLTKIFCENNSTFATQAKEIFKLWNIFSQRDLNKNEINFLMKLAKDIIVNL